MLTQESKSQINNWIHNLQDKYKEKKLVNRKFNKEYWKIFDNTVKSLENEVFKWVIEYKGLYLISNYGRVYSKISEKLLKAALNSDGYLHIGLCKNKREVTKKIHHLVLEAFKGARPDDMECRHLDGNPLNNHINNLCWGTSKENKYDKIIHNTMAKGEKNGRAKLTQQNVKDIRELHKMQYSITELSKKYNVSRRTIDKIIKYETWKY